MIDPLRIGVTVLAISRPRPVLQLLAFWLGGLAMGLAVGIGALFLLRGPALRLMKDMPATDGDLRRDAAAARLGSSQAGD